MATEIPLIRTSLNVNIQFILVFAHYHAKRCSIVILIEKFQSRGAPLAYGNRNEASPNINIPINILHCILNNNPAIQTREILSFSSTFLVALL